MKIWSSIANIAKKIRRQNKSQTCIFLRKKFFFKKNKTYLKKMDTYLPEHLQIAHCYWKEIIAHFDNIIDATCGNGKDSLFLASLLTSGRLFCYDIQNQAIENTKKLFLEKNLKIDSITMLEKSHENFSEIPPSFPIKLITYNLGYLPGGDKSITTQASSTLKSLNQAINIVIPSGAISITCYSHKEGEQEKEAIYSFISELDKKKFNVTVHSWLKKNAPSLVWIVKNY